jgi:hypothetical protein
MRNKLNTFLVVLLVYLSGSPVFKSFEYSFVIVALFVILYSFIIKTKFNKKLLYYLLFYVFIFLMQFFIFKWNTIPGIINRLAIIISGAFIFIQLKEKFRYTYFNVMFWITVIAFPFYILEFITGTYFDLIEVSDPYSHNILIYNTRIMIYSPFEFTRNSGIFWESGAYAGYLLLIPIFFINNMRELYHNNKTKCFVLIVALLSTFSTTGYIVFMIILLYHFSFNYKRKILAYITIIPVFLISALYLYNKVDFLGDKISIHTEIAQETLNTGEINQSRIGGLIFELHYIKKHPLFGNGLHKKTNRADHPYLIDSGTAAYGNGFANFIATMGLVAFIVYLVLISKNLRLLKTREKIFFLFIVILLLQGEPYFFYPLFNGLPFLKLPQSYNL